jgi:hypothetical protein
MTRTTTQRTANRGSRARPSRPNDEATRPTREQRVASGKAARSEVPRESHAEFAPTAARPDPVALLESQASSRVPELLPIRYGRMAVSPFTFFRGAALPMASDLAGTPRTGIVVQACGDALANFGVFASPERRLVFDINDFDETSPGPWEWDVKRLATSLEIAARANGFAAKQSREIVLVAVAAYRKAMLASTKRRCRSGPRRRCRRTGAVRPEAGQGPPQDALAHSRKGADQGQPRRARPLRGDG